MKKLTLALSIVLLMSTSAFADDHRGYDHRDYDHRDYGRHEVRGEGPGWIFPAIITGAILYDLTRPVPAPVAPPPVYVQPVPQTPVLYYCPMYNAYYPNVKVCPNGWQIIPTQPPQQ